MNAVDTACISGYIGEIKATSGSSFLIHIIVDEHDLTEFMQFENMPGLNAPQQTKEAYRAGGLRGVAFEPVPVLRG